jgi:hypothetical protein
MGKIKLRRIILPGFLHKKKKDILNQFRLLETGVEKRWKLVSRTDSPNIKK